MSDRDFYATSLACPSFPCFSRKARPPPKKKNKDFHYPYRAPKIPGKKGKSARKNKDFQKRKGKKNKELIRLRFYGALCDFKSRDSVCDLKSLHRVLQGAPPRGDKFT